jgi:hypothetical protein
MDAPSRIWCLIGRVNVVVQQRHQGSGMDSSPHLVQKLPAIRSPELSILLKIP